MDSTALGVILGLAAITAYSAPLIHRGRRIGGIAIVLFVGAFSLPTGIGLIQAAITGDPAAIPAPWREYVAVSGIICVGLAVPFLYRSVRSAWARGATKADDVEPSDTE